MEGVDLGARIRRESDVDRGAGRPAVAVPEKRLAVGAEAHMRAGASLFGGHLHQQRQSESGASASQ